MSARSAGPRRVRTAVIPVAGLGTRFLPASKAVPKEMLPLVDKPMIQYVIESAVAAGIEEIVFVTAPGKTAIEHHFARAPELELHLRQAGKPELLEAVAHIAELASFVFVQQEAPLGSGHAVLLARDVVGDEPFVMLWADDLVLADPPVVEQLIDAHDRTGGCVVAVTAVPPDAVSRYGIVDVGERVGEGLWPVRRIVEKPPSASAPSNLAAVAGYLLTPTIFDCLEQTPAGRGGEVWLADGVQRLLEREDLFAVQLRGTRYDVGDRLDYLRATVDLALARPDLGPPLREHLAARLSGDR